MKECLKNSCEMPTCIRAYLNLHLVLIKATIDVRVLNYFKFNLLSDPDDNKFVDCAIAANADFIVTHDKDFETLKKLQFPKIKVIDTLKFFTLHYKK